MERVFFFLGEGKDARTGGADSFCDRLNNTHSVFVLALFAGLITTRHYVGEPIGCWCPAHFTSSQVAYTNKVCWTTNTYYLPFEQTRIPKEGDPRTKISYYQWVSLILAFQAVLFYLPRPIWRVFNKKSGIAVSTITDAAIDCQRKSDPDARDKTLRYMVKHMGRFQLELSRNHLLASNFKRFWWSLYGNYLLILYLIIKMLYIANVIGQLFLLNAFLGTNYNMYGFDVMKRMFNKDSWSTSDRFPRVTLCDFKMRVLGNIHRYTVQCSLPMNLFNEIIFIFLWFWFVFVATATTGSLVLWLISAVYPPYQIKYVKSRLIAMDKIRIRSSERVDKFVSNYLRRDGCFIIRLVAKNASDLIAAELICGLWEHYKDNERAVERLFSKEDTVDASLT